MIEFEYNTDKSSANREKHGIDFEEAQMLWRDTRRLEFDVSNHSEPRQIMVAKLNGKLWTAVTTRRGERIRIISVRRSRKNEVEAYEKDND